MALHWEMVHLKGAGRGILKDYSVSVFDSHVDYILGDECMLIAEANPTMSVAPSWDLLMKYEYEVRRLAIRKVNEGACTLAEGMAQARTSLSHRTSYFITPLAMPGSRSHAVAGTSSIPYSAPEPRGNKRTAEEAALGQHAGGAGYPHAGGGGGGGAPKGPKGKAKGAGKDKSKGQPKDLKQMTQRAAYRAIRNAPGKYGVHMSTDKDGKPRCHNYQAGLCTQSSTSCKYSHTCMKCGGAHGATRCPELGLDKL